MNLRSNILKLYLIRFFFSLIPAYVIERLFWEQRGMTIQLVVYTEIIFAISVVFFELPTGILADKWGRKKLLVSGIILEGFMFLILVFATEFWHFAVAIFLAGLARSACSGSENAMLYDTLLQVGEEKTFEKHLGGLNVIDLTAIIIAAISGSLLASRYPFELNYWLSIISMIMSLCVAILLIEPKYKSESDESILMKDYLITSVEFFNKHSDVRIVLLSGMVIRVAVSFIDEFWQLYLNRLGIPVVYFGLFSAITMVVRLPGNLLAHVVGKRFGNKLILCTVSILFVVLFLWVSIMKNNTSLVAIILICFVSGIIEPITTGYLHHRIDSSMRATIDSFHSFGLNIILIIAGLGFGYFSNEYDVFGGYGFIACLCGVFLVYFFISSKKDIIK